MSSIRSDCISLSSVGTLLVGRKMVFSMVLAISARRHRVNVGTVEHRFGDVPLVQTVTSTILSHGSLRAKFVALGSTLCECRFGETLGGDRFLAESAPFSSLCDIGSDELFDLHALAILELDLSV